MPGKLYIVATPIGNLEDITLRALRVLKEVDLILAEDTRVTKKLTTYYKIQTPIESYHAHSSDNKKLNILKELIGEKSVALVTDAGTPGVSDPCNELIAYLLEREPLIQIVPIPGPAALTTAISVSGLNLSRFIFAGFMPKKGRRKLFTQVKNLKLTLVFYESPNRVLKTLDDLSGYFGENSQVFVARELTKLHETLYRGSIGEVKEKLAGEKVRGEITVVLVQDKYLQ